MRTIALHWAEEQFVRGIEAGQFVAFWVSENGQRLTATEGGHATPEEAMVEARQYQHDVFVLLDVRGTLELAQVEE